MCVDLCLYMLVFAFPDTVILHVCTCRVDMLADPMGRAGAFTLKLLRPVATPIAIHDVHTKTMWSTLTFEHLVLVTITNY